MAVLCIEVQGVVVLVNGYGAESLLASRFDTLSRENRFWAYVLISLDIVLLGVLCFLYIIKYIKGEVR
jgi:hypothetical protein